MQEEKDKIREELLNKRSLDLQILKVFSFFYWQRIRLRHSFEANILQPSIICYTAIDNSYTFYHIQNKIPHCLPWPVKSPFCLPLEEINSSTTLLPPHWAPARLNSAFIHEHTRLSSSKWLCIFHSLNFECSPSSMFLTGFLLSFNLFICM